MCRRSVRSRPWIPAAGLTIAVLGCRSLSLGNQGNSTALKDDPASAPLGPAGQFQLGEPGPDLPSAGRSTFDLLISKQANGVTSLEVPYPFEKLVALVSQAAPENELAAAVIPHGRSLQKEAARPDYFKFPRLVLTVGGATDDNAEVDFLDIKRKLFIGYVEPAKALEVISFNEGLGRFEFQIVRNYDAPPAKPEVQFADRSVCTTCHQGHGPIFPSTAWNETNANPSIAYTIGLKLPGTAFVHGVPFNSGGASVNADGVAFMNPGLGVPLFDGAVGDANFLNFRDPLWVEACGDDSLEGARCRAGLLRLDFSAALPDPGVFPLPVDPRTEADQALIASRESQNFATLYPNGLKSISSRFDPLPIPNQASIPIQADFEKLVSNISAAGALDPLIARQPLAIGEDDFRISTDELLFGRRDIEFLLNTVFGGDIVKVTAALDRLIAETVAHTSEAFLSKPYRRDILRVRLFSDGVI